MVWALLFKAPVQMDCTRAFTARLDNVLPLLNILDDLGSVQMEWDHLSFINISGQLFLLNFSGKFFNLDFKSTDQ
jgi:hypothetical protein